MELGLRRRCASSPARPRASASRSRGSCRAEGARRRHVRPRATGASATCTSSPTSPARRARAAGRGDGRAVRPRRLPRQQRRRHDDPQARRADRRRLAGSFELNLMSAVRATRAALPAHARAGRGAIVNVSSTAGKRPSAACPDYSVMKAGMLSFSRLVADVYARDGIRCNAVTPGPTATEAWLGEGGLADAAGRPRRGARQGRRRAAARAARRAGRDRRGDRLPLLRPGLVRDRRRLVAPTAAPSRSSSDRPLRAATLAVDARTRRESCRRLRRADARARGARALAARRALVRDARRERAGGRMLASARRSSATATASCTRSRSAA